MVIPTKKLNNGFEMPVFGLGTWQMGGRDEKNPANDDPRDIGAIKAAVDLGVTHLDTAEVYAEGHAEILLGEAIKTYNRSKLFIASKVYAGHMHHDDLITACQNSLKRVGTEYFDLYYLHRYPGDELLEESLGAMDELAGQGLIKHLAISNFTLEHTAAAVKLSKRPIVATQVHYSLKFREPEKQGLIKFCQENDIMVVAWRPLGFGPLKRGQVRADEVGLVKELAQKYGKTPSQIAINWLVCQKNIVTLTKTSHLEHLKENLGAVGWEMEKGDIEKLRAEFPDQQFISDTVPLG
jgi:diketogulonate reductase-like aldo/keto reductase